MFVLDVVNTFYILNKRIHIVIATYMYQPSAIHSQYVQVGIFHTW